MPGVADVEAIAIPGLISLAADSADGGAWPLALVPVSRLLTRSILQVETAAAHSGWRRNWTCRRLRPALLIWVVCPAACSEPVGASKCPPAAARRRDTGGQSRQIVPEHRTRAQAAELRCQRYHRPGGAEALPSQAPAPTTVPP